MTDRRKLAQLEAARLNKQYGDLTGALGSDEFVLNVLPSGVLSLDYALGIGGYGKGHLVQVFGPPDVGKSSVIGYNAMLQTQLEGGLCGVIAIEPGFSREWAARHGLDPELIVIARPDTVEDAFEILTEWVEGDILDFVLFDSVGAAVSEVERKDGAKSRVGGQSKVITDGVKRITMPVWKNNKIVMFLNQIRDDMNSRYANTYKPPGGNALEHHVSTNIQLKVKGYHKVKGDVDGEEIAIGREIVAIVTRNKLAEGSNRRAIFDYYMMETRDHKLGVDTSSDVLNTALRTGVFEKAGSMYRHSIFPLSNTGFNQVVGKEGVARFFEENPDSLPTIRNDVLAVMLEEQERLREKKKPELKVVNND